jgi:hypothetical protein
MSLDPPLSDAELLRRAIERGAKVDLPPSDTELLQRATRPRPPIDCGPEVKPEPKPSVERRRIPRPRGEVTVGRIERHLEAGRLTGLTATIYGAPRTKKNAASATGGFISTPGYKHWCRGIVAGFLPERNTTLPDEPVNLEAHFYVDVKGVPADLVGLLQGLCDALQAATVVRDDNWIRGFDGSRISYLDKNHPRTELELSPLKEFRGPQNG